MKVELSQQYLLVLAAAPRRRDVSVTIAVKLVGLHCGLQVGLCPAFGAPNSSPDYPTALHHMSETDRSPKWPLCHKWAGHDEQAQLNDTSVAYMTKGSNEVFKKTSLSIGKKKKSLQILT